MANLFHNLNKNFKIITTKFVPISICKQYLIEFNLIQLAFLSFLLFIVVAIVGSVGFELCSRM